MRSLSTNAVGGAIFYQEMGRRFLPSNRDTTKPLRVVVVLVTEQHLAGMGFSPAMSRALVHQQDDQPPSWGIRLAPARIAKPSLELLLMTRLGGSRPFSLFSIARENGLMCFQLARMNKRVKPSEPLWRRERLTPGSGSDQCRPHISLDPGRHVNSLIIVTLDWL